MVPPSSRDAAAAKQREHRRFARHRTDLPLIVKVLGQEGYVRIHGRCTEIAESGLGAVVAAGFRSAVRLACPGLPGPAALVPAALTWKICTSWNIRTRGACFSST